MDLSLDKPCSHPTSYEGLEPEVTAVNARGPSPQPTSRGVQLINLDKHGTTSNTRIQTLQQLDTLQPLQPAPDTRPSSPESSSSSFTSLLNLQVEPNFYQQPHYTYRSYLDTVIKSHHDILADIHFGLYKHTEWNILQF